LYDYILTRKYKNKKKYDRMRSDLSDILKIGPRSITLNIKKTHPRGYANKRKIAGLNFDVLA